MSGNAETETTIELIDVQHVDGDTFMSLDVVAGKPQNAMQISVDDVFRIIEDAKKSGNVEKGKLEFPDPNGKTHTKTCFRAEAHSIVVMYTTHTKKCK